MPDGLIVIIPGRISAIFVDLTIVSHRAIINLAASVYNVDGGVMNENLIPILGVCIPLGIILGGFLLAITAILTKAAARRRELELKYKQIQPAANAGEIAALKEEVAAFKNEVAAFKDMSTQYDMSVEHTLERIEQRLARIEQPEYRPSVNSVETDAVQTIGLRR